MLCQEYWRLLCTYMILLGFNYLQQLKIQSKGTLISAGNSRLIDSIEFHTVQEADVNPSLFKTDISLSTS